MKRNFLYWFVGISVLFIVLDRFGMLSSVKDPFESAILSTKRRLYTANLAVKNFTSLISQYNTIKKIAEEREKFAKENGELILQLNFIKSENEKLRSQLQAPLPASYKFIPSEVVGISRFMELGTGEEAGIRKGMTVVDGINFIGIVDLTSKLRSKVVLPTDATVSIPAKTNRDAKGTVIGQFGNKIIFSKVLQKDPLFLDDQVFTSGEADFVPNLLIGKITHIETNDASVYKQAEVTASVDYQKEKMVFVISAQ